MHTLQYAGGVEIMSLIEISYFKHKTLELEPLEIPRQEIAKTFLGFVMLLKSMGEHNLVHRDACMANILRGATLNDFGSSQIIKELDEGNEYRYATSGTKPRYSIFVGDIRS